MSDLPKRPTTAANLNGLFPPGFDTAHPVEIDVRLGPPASMRWDPPGAFEIADARPLQERMTSEADFFDTHGFVLMPHETTVRDWEAASDMENDEAAQRYFPEIETLIRKRLLPGRRVEVQQWWGPVLRGRGTSAPDYVNAVHSDYGLTPEDFAGNLLAYGGRTMADRWRRSYDRDEVEAFMVIDFWRPTAMAEPLRHMPLALCEPGSVDTADLVQAVMLGIAPSDRPAYQVLLRHNVAQRWCYYPAMTVDEVLAFRQFECRKDEPSPMRWRSVFHSAFEDPDTPADAERRQSSEHRVGVLVLRD